MKLCAILRVAVLALLAAAAASAAVISSAPIGGLSTFQDTNTFRTWVRLDNYFNLSYADMKTDVESKGFTVADQAAVEQLLDSLPLNSGQWSSYAAIMGKAPNRDLIWGSFLPVGTTQAWAWSYVENSSWSYAPESGLGLGDVPNFNSEDADLNIWAYSAGGAAVPEPATIGLAGAALLALLSLRRR